MLTGISAEHASLLDEIQRRLGPLGLDPQQSKMMMNYLERASRPPTPQMPSGNTLVPIAQRLHETRAAANRVFGAPVLSDPRLDMLLRLYIQRSRGDGTSVGALCAAAQVPVATGLRHITKLEKFGLVTREGDADDKRRTWISLTPKAVQSLECLLSSLQASMLAQL